MCWVLGRRKQTAICLVLKELTSHTCTCIYSYTHTLFLASPVFSLQAYSGHLCVPGMGSSDRHESKLVHTPEAQDSWGDRRATLRCYGGVWSRRECAWGRMKALQPNDVGMGEHLRGLPEGGDKPSLKDKKVLDDALVSPVGQDFSLWSCVRRWGMKWVTLSPS